MLFSAELSELQSLSDRLLVLYEGKVALEMEAEDLAKENARATIGAAMTGAHNTQGVHEEAGGD